MRTRAAIVVSLLLPIGCSPGEPDTGPEASSDSPASFADADVQRIHQRMVDVIAPDDGWERARYIEFDWAVNRGDGEPLVRSHRWDRWEGLARVEAPVNDGVRVAIFDTDDPTAGRVWLDGQEVTGDEAEDHLESAYQAHINDAYWFLMPFKWDDPGVTATYLGEQQDSDGRTWEVVELAFEGGTGLTPQNRYHAFVNPETGRMERWHYFADADADPSPSDWTDWQRVGPIELAENRRVDGEPRIFFPHMRVETEVPSEAFDPPAD